MSSVDIDIYVSQMIRFFDSNPNDLATLIGNMEKEIFYKRIKEIAKENYQKNSDPSLTKTQMVEIVADMYKEIQSNEQNMMDRVEKIFMDTKMGKICLN